MRQKRQMAAGLLALLTALSLTACGTEPSGASPTGGEEGGSATEPVRLTFVLDWTPNTNHTGVYAAIDQGYFAQAGLEVEVVQPPEDGAEMLVASGRAQFGVSAQGNLADALSGEAPMPVTAVAAVLQHNTAGIISRKGEGMDRPSGMESRRYATWDRAVEKAVLRQVVESDGGDFSRVELVPSTVTDAVSGLESRSVDAIWVFYGWEGIACEAAGLETDFFALKDIDPVFDYYTPVIIGGNEFLAQHPQTARTFLAALSKGYEFAAEHPEEAARILMNAAPELKDSQTLVVESQKYLAEQYIADAARWGQIDDARWSAYYTWLNDHDLLEKGRIDPHSGYTNAFLPES